MESEGKEERKKEGRRRKKEGRALQLWIKKPTPYNSLIPNS
jgi:hypothetical protein